MLYIITAVHNRFNITQKFVSCLKGQSFQDFKLILVDDGSNDGTDKMVKDILPDSIVLYGNGNLWWGGALHKAYKYIKHNQIDKDDYVMIVNDDTTIKEDFLQIAINLLKKNKNALITACGFSKNTSKIIDGAVKYNFVTGHATILEPGLEGNCTSTRSLFFSVGDFLKIGGFHPILLPHYASDYEFTIRAFKKGYKICSFSELKYFFDENTTGNKNYMQLDYKNFLKKVFSKRSIYNPIYRIMFILLACPKKYIIPHLFFQTKRYISNIAKYLYKK